MNTTTDHSKSTLARSLGYAALGLGAAELLACRRIARLMGIRPTPWKVWTLRSLGAREVLTGFGVLSKRPTPWLGARVLGDALDITLLLRGLRRRNPISVLGRVFGESERGSRIRTRTVLAGLAGISALDLVELGRTIFGRKSSAFGERPALRATITVDKTPSDVYSFWRNVENFPSFVSQLESVASGDRIRSHWKAKLANKATLEWDATIVEDTPDQRLLWKVQNPTMRLFLDTVEVRFELAPGGRGTEVHVVLWGSQLEKPVAASRWLRKLPEGLLFDQLRRFKQVIELGEITQSDSSIHLTAHPARPRSEGE